jgi:hypothetical protein
VSGLGACASDRQPDDENGHRDRRRADDQHHSVEPRFRPRSRCAGLPGLCGLAPQASRVARASCARPAPGSTSPSPVARWSPQPGAPGRRCARYPKNAIHIPTITTSITDSGTGLATLGLCLDALAFPLCPAPGRRPPRTARLGRAASPPGRHFGDRRLAGALPVDAADVVDAPECETGAELRDGVAIPEPPTLRGEPLLRGLQVGRVRASAATSWRRTTRRGSTAGYCVVLMDGEATCNSGSMLPVSR